MKYTQNQKNLIRAVGIVLGLSLIGKGILANVSIFTFTYWLLPIGMFLGSGILAARRMNLENLWQIKTWGVIITFGFVGKMGADFLYPFLVVYEQPIIPVIIGAIIFLIAFKGD